MVSWYVGCFTANLYIINSLQFSTRVNKIFNDIHIHLHTYSTISKNPVHFRQYTCLMSKYEKKKMKKKNSGKAHGHIIHMGSQRLLLYGQNREYGAFQRFSDSHYPRKMFLAKQKKKPNQPTQTHKLSISSLALCTHTHGLLFVHDAFFTLLKQTHFNDDDAAASCYGYDVRCFDRRLEIPKVSHFPWNLLYFTIL